MPHIDISWYPYSLQLKHRFTISANSRISTPAVMVELEFDGYTGYGEASLPPYLPETQQSVQSFLQKIDWSAFGDITDLPKILSEIDRVSPGNNAAKASLDIALHDLSGKIQGLPVYVLYGINKKESYTSYTIGIDSPELIAEKLKEAHSFRFIKVKLGSTDDKKIIRSVRANTDKPLYVDVNRGWKNREEALDLIHWLHSQNVLLVEQPFSIENIDDTAWLKERSPLPIIADESVKRLSDIAAIKDAYSGINIKLMKSTGILEAYKMIERARELNLRIMLGCMTESSCAISAAAHLSSLCDWIDLDGNILINNDIFNGVKAEDGRIVPSEIPGLGIQKLS
jgi:L-Ala-D/L-Glu epimerase